MPVFHVQAPDGSTFEYNVPDGVTEDQVLQHAQSAFQQQNKVEDPGMAKTALDQFNQGTTFGWGDELTDRMGAAINANATMPKNGSIQDFVDAYDASLPQARESTKKELASEWENHPVTAFGANLAGGIATGKALGATKLAQALGNTAGRGINAAKAYSPVAGYAAKVAESAGLGAGSGALYGAGSADEGHRTEGAETGAKYGLAVGAAVPVVQDAYAGLKGALSNVVSSTDKRVGQALGKLASDPNQALNKLQNLQDFVPNSPQTVAEAAADPGLSSAQRALRNAAPEDFADTISQQNAARNSYLEDVAKTPKDIELAEQAREAATAPMRDQAFKAKKNVLPGEPLDKIDQILASPSGKRDAVNDALSWAREKIKGVKDPEELYEIRKDIAEAISGKYDADKPSLRRAASQLMNVRDALDQTIERGAPGYKDYMEKYTELSKPISEMKTLQEAHGGNLSTQYDPATQRYYLSQPKFSNYMRANEQDLLGEVAKGNMTQENLDRLKNTLSDLNRSSYANNPAIKPAGSDTIANATKNGKISGMMAKGATKLPWIGEGIGRYQEAQAEALKKALAKTMNDPAKAAELLARYGIKNPGALGAPNLLATQTFSQIPEYGGK